MATRKNTLRLTAETQDDTGLEPVCAIDTDSWPGELSLSGFKVDEIATIALSPSAADQAVTITNVVGLILVSDQPFSLRYAAGETLLANLRLNVIYCDDTDDHAATTSVLLTGNGTNEALVKVYQITKP